jgi:4-methylaminobutanoate oxidase (formaldehyde-forming)
MTAPERLANRELDASILAPTDAPPERARVVIVGGGIAGSSVAYHLTKLGVADVIVLERTRLTGGTTWHAAGLVAQVRGTHALTELSRINASLYESLPSETGVETGLRRVGSLSVARTEARMREYLAGVSIARDVDVPVEVVDAARVQELWPAASVDDVVGGTYFPTDATVNPGDAALALAKGAYDRGARFVFGPSVTGFRIERGRVTGVRTDRGDVEAESVVLAAGLWTSELARLAEASVSMYPAEHVWVTTEPAAAAAATLPILRDPDGYLYVRHYDGRFLVGAFEPQGKPKRPGDVDTGGFVELGPDWDHFAPVLRHARERVPELRDIGFEHYLRAPESFTPDSSFHLGELPEVRGLFVAAGFNSQGIIYSPGAGKALAEWIVEGRPTMDLVEVDVARAGRWANHRSWLHDRTGESLGRLYAMHWPALQAARGRGVRRFPLHDRLRAAGAAFGEAAGWERPAWYTPGARDPAWAYDFDRPGWFDALEEEVRATREGVALYDLSSYAKFLVQGSGAAAGLQRVCASNLDVEPGRVVYTLICNDRGGIEMDPTVTRLGEDRFWVIAPTLAQRRTEMLLRTGLPDAAVVTDVTSGWATLHLAGPRSRELLARLTDADLDDDSFPFLGAREIEVGWARAWALRVSFTGELGWELYVPTELVADLYERLVETGADLGLRHAGAFAFDAARLERGFRSWGHDMGPLDDPFAAGLGFAVAKAGDHVGHDALAGLRDAPQDRRLVSVRVPGATLWHGESVLHDGERVGHVTSGGRSPTLGEGSVGLAWVHGVLEGEWAVEVRAEPVPAEVRPNAFFDPGGDRARR